MYNYIVYNNFSISLIEIKVPIEIEEVIYYIMYLKNVELNQGT